MILLRVRYTRHTAAQKKKLVNKKIKKFKQQTKKPKCASIRQRKARKDVHVLMINLQSICINKK